MQIKKDRKLNRWPGYDYSWPGYYYVTICTKDRINYFGDIIDYEMKLNEIGDVVYNFWQDIPKHFNNCKLDEFVVMPNHIHGILYIFYKNENKYRRIVGNADLRSLQNTQMLLSKIIQQFKSSATRKINKQNNFYFQWQRSFHDRVIRNEPELLKIREYIINNPINWQNDKNNQLM